MCLKRGAPSKPRPGVCNESRLWSTNTASTTTWTATAFDGTSTSYITVYV